MKILLACCLAVALLGLSNCESGSAPEQSSAPKQESKTAQKHTGREAFQRLLVAARGWAPDAQPFRMQSGVTKEFPGHDGQAVIWTASFASAGRRSMKTFQWSGVNSPDMPAPGISSGTEDSYNPANSSTRVFEMVFFKTDSPTAFSVAQKHGGAKILKQDPNQPVTYTLDWDNGQNSLLWHVNYGTSPSDAKLRIAVSASVGTFYREEK